LKKKKSAIDILNQNIKKLKLEKKVLIVNQSVHKFINNSFKEPFNLVFLDPPFKENNIAEIIEIMKKTEKLDKKALFIVHRHKKSQDIFPKNFKILDEKKYGLSKIIFGN
jgi:16S rRNA (guanine966-N2)-methyltransferase